MVVHVVGVGCLDAEGERPWRGGTLWTGASVWLLTGVSVWAAASGYRSADLTPPEPVREFRAVWVATVSNIDWPSKPGLPVRQQQAELLALLDRAVQLRLNAVILQVRPACDALYASRYEPWSEYLTGRMGQAPSPFYDPLAFAVKAAHERGLELHAWFNPFRARHSTGRSPVAAEHISRTQPQLVRTYGRQLWLDPGERAAHDHTLRVILDVVRCYDIDGVHLDDYFYPYPERDTDKNRLDFPDEPTWQKYVATGGKLSRADWRRDNIDRFIQRLYQAVKAERRRVKVGLSPFGVWRPGFPPQVKRAFDAYANLYADSRKWFEQGWLDYLAPQLYWPTDAPDTSFPVLLGWWAEQNAKGRHLWPGLSLYCVAAERQPTETVRQIRFVRQTVRSAGHVLWNARALMQDRGGLVSALAEQSYSQPAVIPAMPWLDQRPPRAPTLRVASERGSGLKVRWDGPTTDSACLWVVQTRWGGRWETQILPNRQTTLHFGAQVKPEAIVVRAVSRCGQLSAPAAVEQVSRASGQAATKTAPAGASRSAERGKQ